MDPRIIALRKAAALERIDAGLKRMAGLEDFSARLVNGLNQIRGDALLKDLRRFEVVAEIVTSLAERQSGIKLDVSREPIDALMDYIRRDEAANAPGAQPAEPAASGPRRAGRP